MPGQHLPARKHGAGFRERFRLPAGRHQSLPMRRQTPRQARTVANNDSDFLARLYRSVYEIKTKRRSV
nr:MAG TPA: hypothetical protein [Inoviridae sp.]